jgi:hypothetical protein
MLLMTGVTVVTVRHRGGVATGKGGEAPAGLSRTEDAPAVAAGLPDVAKQPAKVPPKEEWANADKSDAPDIGGLRVRVKAAEIGRPHHYNPGGGVTIFPEDCLLIWIEVLNFSGTKKFDYSGWGWRRSTASLTDTFDNRYKHFHNGFGDPWRYNWITWKPGATTGTERRLIMTSETSILPGTGLDDLLVFENVPSFGHPHFLKLELPAANVGQEGTYRFKIPFGMVKRQ